LSDRPVSSGTKSQATHHQASKRHCPKWISSQVGSGNTSPPPAHIHPLTSLTEWSSYLLSSSNPFRPYILPFLSYTSILKAYTTPLLNALTQKPDLATLALLLLILFLSLKILNMLLSTVMFWLRLAFRVLFWGSLAIVGLWMWTRGPEGILEDLGYWGRAWTEEYKYFTERSEQRMAKGTQQPYGSAAGWK
jgi:hypothetical protein